MTTQVSMRQLLETGVHFGHRTRKWNPKMKPYIFTERNGIHILDLQQTLKSILDTFDLVRDTVAQSGTVFFVGTKRQAQETIMRESERCGMPYVNQRWLGGTLTNWRTIRQRIDHLKALEARRDRGEFELLTKKEALLLTREIDKLNYRLGGIREMTRLPDLMFIVDVHREYTAIHEANILKIPIIALVDTNCDPDQIDHIIPANDDAIRAIKLLTATIADAALEGINMRKDDDEGEETPAIVEIKASPDDSDEAYLGEATLAKLASGDLSFEADKVAKQAQADDSDAPAAETETEAAADAAAEAAADATSEEAADAASEEATDTPSEEATDTPSEETADAAEENAAAQDEES